MEGEEVSNLGGLVSWWQYDIIETIDKQPSKLKLQLKTGDIKGIEGKKATLTMENIIEYNSYDILTQVNLAEHLNDKSEDLAKEVIPNQDRRYNEKLIALGDEQEIAFKESIPRYLLPSKGLNRQLFSERPEVKLDNIGFIDGQLHIKIKGQTAILF